MSDLSRFVANKLSGEWSAGNVAGVLTDVIIEYLVAGDRWESMDPLVRSRLLLAPLFMRKRDLAELQPALAKLAAAGAADKDEWVRAMAQSVGPYDGRLHTDALLAGTKLVGKTVAGLQPVLDSADPRIFRPQEELYMNKDLLKRLRGAAGAAQPTSAAAATGAPKPHHHFRLRPAGEAPSGGQPGGGPGRPQQQSQQPAAAAHAPSGTARGATPLQRPGGGAGGSRAPGAAPVGSTARLGRPQPTDIDSMFLPRKPSLPRPAGLAGRGRGAAPPPRRAATLDVEAVKSLNEQMQAAKEKAEKAKQEAAEAEARAKAEARERERAVKEAEKEVEAKRQATAKAAEKAAAKEAKGAERGAGKGASEGEQEEKQQAQAARAEAAAARAAAKVAKQEERAAKQAAKEERQAAKAARAEAAGPGKAPQRKRPASAEGGGDEPPAKRPTSGGSEAPAALLSPEATAAALGDAALAAAADAAGMQLEGGVDAMQAYLAAQYGAGGQQCASSDEEEPDV